MSLEARKHVQNSRNDAARLPKLEKNDANLEDSIEDYTRMYNPQRDFYKNVIKKLYIKWKPLIDESISEAHIEIENKEN